MEKLVYLFWARSSGTTELTAELLERTGPALLAAGARKLELNLADERVAAAQSARRSRLDPPFDGMVSFWLDTADDRARHEDLLAETCSRLAGYLVLESVPLRNSTHLAARGEPIPGINMLACIERPEWISYEKWIEHWHGPHRRVALETQSTFLYVRNVVVRALTAEAPPWSGIVEEGFPSAAVTDPLLWYQADGSAEKLRENLGRMVESCQQFLDLDRVESHPLTQYLLSD